MSRIKAKISIEAARYLCGHLIHRFAMESCPFCGYGFFGTKPRAAFDGDPERIKLGPEDIPYREDQPCPNCGKVQIDINENSKSPRARTEVPEAKSKKWILAPIRGGDYLIGPYYEINSVNERLPEVTKALKELFTAQSQEQYEYRMTDIEKDKTQGFYTADKEVIEEELKSNLEEVDNIAEMISVFDESDPDDVFMLEEILTHKIDISGEPPPTVSFDKFKKDVEEDTNQIKERIQKSQTKRRENRKEYGKD